MTIKNKIILAGATLLSLASCETKVVEPTQADIDKEVAVKVMAIREQLQADCDNGIMAEANRRADSILIAKANKPVPAAPVAAPAPAVKKKAPTKKVVKKKVVKEAPAPKTTKTGGLRSQSDKTKANDKTTTKGGGLRSQSDVKKAQDSKGVRKGGLRSRSDQNTK